MKCKNIKNKKSSGFSIIEIVLAVSLFSIIVLGSLSSALYGETSQVEAGARKRSTLLADQTIEILRSFRDSHSQGFTALVNGTYGLTRDWNGAWELSNSPDTVDSYFLRTITITSPDSFTKQIVTNICWPVASCPSSGTTVSFDTYLTNWRGAIAGTPGGIKVAVSGEGHAYMITTDNTLEVYDVSAPASPVKVGTLTLAGATGTLPSNLFYSSGKVYIASGDFSAEMQIVDVSSPSSPQALGTLNIAVDGDDTSTADGVWADSSTGEAFLLAHDSAGISSQFFMIDVRDATAPAVWLAGDIYTTSTAQTPGGISAGQISSSDTMCNTGGGSVADGYVLHCYNYNFDFATLPTPMPSFIGTVTTTNAGLSPSRTVVISGGHYFTSPGGKISEDGSTPVTISTNPIYNMSIATRSGRLYAYLAVPDDTTSGLKEVDIDDINNPVIITARNTDGAFTGTIYDNSTSPEYIFGSNKTGLTLGFVSFAPTTVGINMTPFAGITATTVKGASLVHCDPIVSPTTDHGCPQTYTLTNVTGGSISYTISADESWVLLSSAGGSLSGGGSTTFDASIDVDAVNTADLSENIVHTATITLTYGSTDITRTVSLTVNPALGIKVRAR